MLETNRPVSEWTPQEVHSHLRTGFASGATFPLSFRLSQLQLLRKFLYDTESDLIAAIQKDFRKNFLEALSYDLSPITGDIAYFLHHLPSLVKPTFCNRDFSAPLYLEKRPLGVVLMFAPFNFPIHLALRPMVAAIAAGNAVCLKPSEVSTESEKYLCRLRDVLDSRLFHFVTGGPSVCTELLSLQWDHIFFTGNSVIGRVVMTAAAKHLTPVTLELGGKSPAIVTDTAHVKLAAVAIARARFCNCGQFCMAADYCLVDESVYDEFVREILDTVKHFFSEDPKTCARYSRVVSSRHLNRLADYLQNTSGRVLMGGDYDDSDNHYFAPTVVEVADENDVLMQAEMFGPILPIFKVKSTEESVRIVLSKEKPLSMYLFCHDKTLIRDVLDRVTSGSAAVNDTMWQIGGKGSFIGGVGESGMGRYGEGFGFDTFSHSRLVLHSTARLAAKMSAVNPTIYVDDNWMLEYAIRLAGRIPFRGSGGVPWTEKADKMKYAVVSAAVLLTGVALAVGLSKKR